MGIEAFEGDMPGGLIPRDGESAGFSADGMYSRSSHMLWDAQSARMRSIESFWW